jgi:hypothetical protein
MALVSNLNHIYHAFPLRDVKRLMRSTGVNQLWITSEFPCDLVMRNSEQNFNQIIEY